ncbi:MAG: hypothetical protein ABIH03_02755, partial [Pseudomonadota bacterium]
GFAQVVPYTASQMQSRASSGHCALRAPTKFSGRIKSSSAQKTWLLIKTNNALGLLWLNIVDCAGLDFHPRASDDPRGRLLVRA